MKKLLPANRVAALGGSAAAVAAAIVAVLGAVDSIAKAVVVSVALVVIGVVVVVFLRGSQSDEARRALHQPSLFIGGHTTGTTSTANVTVKASDPGPDPEYTPDPAPPKADQSVALSHLDGGAA